MSDYNQTLDTPVVGSYATSQNPELSIVMPCLNEAETLEVCIRKAQEYLARSGVQAEILIGDNGSTDGSQAIAERCGARVINVPVRGYGAALYGASTAARGKYIIMGDSDDSYDFSKLDPFLARLRAGDEIVMGNRFLGGIAPGAMPWKNRYIGNPLLPGIGKMFFRCPVDDFHCGIRGYTKQVFEELDLRTTGMEFASEMVIKGTLMKRRLSEVPTTLSKDGRSRPPHLLPWRDGWRHLRFMLLYSPNWLFLYPGILLMAICLVAGAALLVQPLHIGGLRFSIDTLIFAAFGIAVGLQAALFSMLTRVYAVQEGLLPKTPQYVKTFKYITLERGLILGLLILMLGFVTAIFAVVKWREHGFGDMDVNYIARLAVSSATAITIGVETVLFSLFFSVLGLGVRHSITPASLGIEAPIIETVVLK